MKLSMLIVLFAFLFQSQPVPHPALQSLIDAERNFAQTSVDKNTRDAFVANMDENSLVFQRGEPLNGLTTWSAYEPDNNYLFWWPEYADIASSGDFGYTTGPAEFGGERNDPKPVGGMYYSSVWKKNSAGEWKIAADMGSARYTPGTPKVEVKTTAFPLKASKQKPNAEKEKGKLLDLDKAYVGKLNEAKKSVIASYFHSEGRIHHGGRGPVTTPVEIQEFTEPGSFTFQQLGGDVASSADMGFVYGKVDMVREKDGQPQTLHLNYMRVWKKFNGDWKIVLDVIG